MLRELGFTKTAISSALVARAAKKSDRKTLDLIQKAKGMKGWRKVIKQDKQTSRLSKAKKR